MKLRKKMIAMLLAGTMVLGIGITGIAAPTIPTGTEAEPQGAEIVKTLQMAQGITTPDATFTFKFTKVTTDAPDIADKSLTYSSGDVDGQPENGLSEIQKSTGNILEGVTFSHAGVFEYTVAEDRTGDAGGGYGMHYSQAQYTMKVYVKNGTDGTYVYAVEILQDKYDDGTDGDGTKVDDPTPGTGEDAGMLFTNVYTKKGGSDVQGSASSLEISKTVTGDYADKTRDFSFNITIHKAATVTDEAPVYTGTIGEEEFSFTAGTAQEVQLRHGEKLVFEDLPAGTAYTVTEAGTDLYTPYADVTQNGAADSRVNASEGAMLSVSNKLVGEKANSTAFTNAYDEEQTITPTGIVIDNFPFILLIVAAIAGLVLYMAGKRRPGR